MAKKKEENKIVLERTYNVPLRKGFQKAPKYRRAKKAINTLKEFLIKHMKSEDIKIGKYLNEEVWDNGIKNPPHHVKIVVKKHEDGKVFAELEGYESKEAKQKKKDDKKSKKKPVKKKDIPKTFEKKEQKTDQKEIKEEVKETKEEAEKEAKEEKTADKKEEEIKIKDALGG